MGFIFYPASKRYVGLLDVDLLNSIPRSIKKTGVFVNEEGGIIVDTVKKYGLDAVQLHGDESPEFCSSLRTALDIRSAGAPVEIIKAFGIDPDFDFSRLQPYEDHIAYFLFDTQTAGYGGSGSSFDWEILRSYKGSKPYFLSGGIGPENIDRLMALEDPRLYAADLNSRFEIEPGMKDINRLRPVFKLIN